jgi:hypothetical protein
MTDLSILSQFYLYRNNIDLPLTSAKKNDLTVSSDSDERNPTSAVAPIEKGAEDIVEDNQGSEYGGKGRAHQYSFVSTRSGLSNSPSRKEVI